MSRPKRISPKAVCRPSESCSCMMACFSFVDQLERGFGRTNQLLEVALFHWIVQLVKTVDLLCGGGGRRRHLSSNSTPCWIVLRRSCGESFERRGDWSVRVDERQRVGTKASSTRLDPEARGTIVVVNPLCSARIHV